MKLYTTAVSALLLGILPGIAQAQECIAPLVPATDVVEQTPISAAQQTTEACTVSAPTISVARLSFALTCGSSRPDCDPVNGEWQCSNVAIGESAPEGFTNPGIVAEVVVDPIPEPIAELVPEPVPEPVQAISPDPEPTPEPVQVAETDIPVLAVTTANSVTADTLPEAIALFDRTFPSAEYRDCDPVGNVWECSSETIGSGGPGDGPGGTASVAGTAQSPVAPSSTGGGNIVLLQAESQSASGWADRGTYIEWLGGNDFTTPGRGVLNYSFVIPDDAAGVYEMRWRARAAVPHIGTDGQIDPRENNDAWARMTGSNVSGFVDVRDWVKVFSSGNGDWHVAGTVDPDSGPDTPFRQNLSAGQHTFSISGRSQHYAIDFIELVRVDAPITVGSTTRAGSGDLMSLHWDCSYDYDDLQAMVATRLMLDDNDFDHIAVSGARRFSHPDTNPGCHEHMVGLFPSVPTFSNLNGGPGNNPEAVATVATIWQLVLAEGNDVWIAEGGPSDFTADVLRVLQARGVGDLDRIHVVQHSVPSPGRLGWNEVMTHPDNIALVQSVTDYIGIGNGNDGNNSTPEYYVKNHQNAAGFQQAALQSTYANAWAFAFSQVHNETRIVDFSDAVEVAYILGIDPSVAPDGNGFIAEYF